jgi:HTH-type transcriptional repressor of NAD biosynthesis genes
LDAVVHVLGACHSGAETLCADLALALPLHTVLEASPEWLAAPPHSLPAQGRHCWLLCGLDLDCPVAQQAQRQREDASLRAQLMRLGVVFRVVYGSTPEQRLSQALQAVDAVAPCSVTALHRASEASQRLRPMCEQCSDPECERKLFSGLKR